MRIFLLLFTFLAALGLSAQNNKLAEQYYRDGEYEKSARLYLELSENNRNNDFYFERYISSMMEIEQYKDAEGALKKRLKKTPYAVRLYVTYGRLLEAQLEQERAKEQYEKAITKLTGDRYQITQLANAFIQLTKYPMAIRTYERGAELLSDSRIFSYDLGNLYRRKGDKENMVINYLNSVEDNPKRT